MKDYYKILGVKKEATREEIRNRYLELVKHHHPDTGAPTSESEEILKEINEAYEVLKEEASRLDYDLKRSLLRAYLKGRKQGLRRLWGGKRPLYYASILCVLILITGLLSSKGTSLRVENPPPPGARLPVLKNPAPLTESASSGGNGPKPSGSVAIQGGSKAFRPRPEGAPRDLTTTRLETHPVRERIEEDPFRSFSPVAEEKKEAPVTGEEPTIGLALRAALSSEALQAAEIEPSPPASPLSDEEVRRFLDRYIDHYVRKDLEGFLSLFSPKAIQNGREELARIKEVYGRFFERSERLTYKLDDIKIAIHRNASEVKGRYQVNQKLKDRPEEKIWRGDILWKLEREEGALRIFALDYHPVR